MFKIKPGVKIEDLQELVPEMFTIFGEVLKYCQIHKMEVVITSIKSDRINIETVSDTHATGRGLDIRTRDWTQKQIDDLEVYINIHCQQYEALSSNGSGRVAYYHNNHLHLQCSRKFLK